MQLIDISQRLKGLITKGVEPIDPQEEMEENAPLRERIVVEGYDTYISQAYSWRLISIAEALALVVLVFFLIYMGCWNRFVPYVITLGAGNDSFSVHEAKNASTVNEAVVIAHIKQFIVKSRSIVSDIVIQNYNINAIVYPMLAGQARAYIDEWYKMEEYQPFARMEKGTIDVQVNAIVPYGNGYEVTWTEFARSKMGNITASDVWEATLGTSFFPIAGVPRRTNPLGFYITTLNWTKKL
jgi:type IV secretory pathway TrbF-like protein